MREQRVNGVAAVAVWLYVARAMQRQPLRSLKLTGARAKVRSLAFWTLFGCAAVAGIGYVLPAHRVGSDVHFHSNFADGGIRSQIALFAALAILLVLRNLRFGAGIVAGIVAMAGAVLAVMPLILAHMFQSVDYAYGDFVFASGVLGMFFGGVAMIIVEPVLYVVERRRLERATRPAPLPAARAFA